MRFISIKSAKNTWPQIAALSIVLGGGCFFINKIFSGDLFWIIGVIQEKSINNRGCWHWYRLSALRNNPEGMYLYGRHLMDVKDRDSTDKGMCYLNRSASCGNQNAMRSLVGMYSGRRSLYTNRPLAVFYLQELINTGDPKAKRILARLYEQWGDQDGDESYVFYSLVMYLNAYLQGESVLPLKIASRYMVLDMWENALPWLYKAWKAGDSEATVLYGMYAELRIGGDDGNQNAMEWYKKGVELNNSIAMYSLGSLYLRKYPDHRHEGIELIKKASALGYERASKWLLTQDAESLSGSHDENLR